MISIYRRHNYLSEETEPQSVMIPTLQEALREVSADLEHRRAYPISISVGPVEFQHDQLIVMIAGLGRRSADATASE